jgi:ribosomal protein S4E
MVDEKVQREELFPTGLMDVVSISDLENGIVFCRMKRDCSCILLLKTKRLSNYAESKTKQS